MRRAPIAAAVLLAFGAGAMPACHWVPRKQQLPKPVDWPIVRENVKEYHKVGNKQNHPPDWTGGVLPAI
jgi:hypothetical protein